MNERIELVKSSIELVKGISSAIAAEKIKEAEDKNSDAYKVAQQKLNDSGVANPTPEQISQQVQRDYGTGSSFQKASQAVAGIVQGILVGDIGALIGGAAAPYLAQAVKQLTEGDDTANLMAHAVLGAVLAKAQGGSALAGAAGASVGELIASQLYPGKSREELTESEKQTIAALSTLAGGLSGALAGGDAFNAALGAGTAKNAVENNHLSDIERLSLQALQREYESSCNGSTTSDCQDLSGEIAELIAKDLSVLKDEVLSEDNDFTRAMVHTTSPGDVISCATSPNGFCVATDKTITTDRGEEWVLQPASFEQAIEGKTRNDLDNAIITAQLQGVSNELFSAGCGGAGVAGVACQGFMAAGGENPITGEVASNTERVMWGIQGLLNIWGLGGSIFSGGAKGFTSDLTEVWGLKPTQRGVAIESYLARTEYSAKSGWYNVGAERNGYFPLVDFQNGNTLVSLKSVDTAGGTWLNRMQDHIIDLGSNGAKVNGNPASMVLDLRVQPGGLGAAKSLIDFGREYNVKVIIKEFK
jgi:filamentous hemagglutinin